MLRRTKIVATLGPSCNDPSTLQALLLAGMNVLRVNFSHANAEVINTILLAKNIAENLNLPLAIMADLQGPKIRIGKFINGSITLINQQTFTLDCLDDQLIGDEHKVYVAYPNLNDELAPGDSLLLNDGLIELEVLTINASQIHCTVIEGGLLADKKGLNRKGGGLAARTLTEKDKTDLQIAIKAGVDYINLSFVKDANDIHSARALLAQYGAAEMPIIAKIERTEALVNLTEIIEASDAVMVARGDLGVEIGAAEIPAIQKLIISKARQMNKVVITATQMMESMISNPQPTRAEVSDVANAILDGTDAVMLSAETASGMYPLKVVTMVNKICLSTECHAIFSETKPEICAYERPDQAIAIATMHAANHFPVQAIIALTESGTTALSMSRYFSTVPIFAVTANKNTQRRLSLVSNVFPIYMDYHALAEKDIKPTILKHLLDNRLLEKTKHVLITRGLIIGKPGGTNCMEIIEV
jgi:pyruvate kinase